MFGEFDQSVDFIDPISNTLIEELKILADLKKFLGD
jgi:hypothetical protein